MERKGTSQPRLAADRLHFGQQEAKLHRKMSLRLTNEGAHPCAKNA
jgi:hypothetical protein